MGQPEIVSALYATALPRLGAYAYLLTGNYSDAEDLVQSAIIKVCARPRRLQDLPSAEAYVRAAIRTIHLDGLRRTARWQRAVPKLAAQAGTDHGMEDATASKDAVAQALAQLPPRVRATIALFYWDDLSVKDIAAHMRISEGTVKAYLRDGREALAPLLGEDEGGDRIDIQEVRS